MNSYVTFGFDFFFFSLAAGSLCSPRWPGIYNSPASASQILELQACNAPPCAALGSCLAVCERIEEPASRV